MSRLSRWCWRDHLGRLYLGWRDGSGLSRGRVGIGTGLHRLRLRIGIAGTRIIVGIAHDLFP